MVRPAFPTSVPTSHVCTMTFILYWPAFVLQRTCKKAISNGACMPGFTASSLLLDVFDLRSNLHCSASQEQLRTAHLKNATLRGAPGAVSRTYSSHTAAAILAGEPWMWSSLQQG